jgi:hypothetical protein
MPVVFVDSMANDDRNRISSRLADVWRRANRLVVGLENAYAKGLSDSQQAALAEGQQVGELGFAGIRRDVTDFFELPPRLHSEHRKDYVRAAALMTLGLESIASVKEKFGKPATYEQLTASRLRTAMAGLQDYDAEYKAYAERYRHLPRPGAPA